ncbi:MAG: hypothetical protein HP490_11530 [Nitrospira sp.]|nr:hypothetical protein [Nitrospira sp.]
MNQWLLNGREIFVLQVPALLEGGGDRRCLAVATTVLPGSPRFPAQNVDGR